MQCGSTGLGKMALKMRLASEEEMTKLPPTKPPEGSLVMYCKTYDPVIWCVWISIEPKDLWQLMKVMFSRRMLKFVLGLVFGKLIVRKTSGSLDAEGDIKTYSG